MLNVGKVKLISRLTNKLLKICHLMFETDILQGKTQWALWSWSVYSCKLHLFTTILDNNGFQFISHHLLHGKIPVRLLPFSVCSHRPTALHFCCRGLHDGCGFSGSKFLDGTHCWGRIYCKNTNLFMIKHQKLFTMVALNPLSNLFSC